MGPDICTFRKLINMLTWSDPFVYFSADNEPHPACTLVIARPIASLQRPLGTHWFFPTHAML